MSTIAIVRRCVSCGLILGKLQNEPSNSSETSGASAERCLKCIMKMLYGPSAIEFAPNSADFKEATFLLQLLNTETLLRDLRSYFVPNTGYHNQGIEEILTSGTCLAPFLFHKYEPSGKMDVLIKSTEIVNRPNYLAYDAFLCLEFAKTVDAFRRLSLKDQILQAKRVIMPITLFTEAYLSRISGHQNIVLPNNSTPSMIEYPENPTRPLSLFKSLQRAHLTVFASFMMGLDDINLTAEEYLLLKQLMLSFSQDIYNAPQLSQAGQTILGENFDRFNAILRRFLSKSYPAAEATRRAHVMTNVVAHYFKLANNVTVLHNLIKEYHGKEKLAAAFLDEISQ
ncbi:ligand-binding domain of nuclear hormone receptor domain-containing protein [Ditylenchus destructor]|nr:ligand-binding domain of nuclear hormone receptor domain-containing protein [Ditylenchus destructor]